MKSIMEELNHIDNMPIMQVDDSLKIYSEQNRFAKKRENATALIKRVGLPKPDLYTQPQEVENSNDLISFQEKKIRKVWHDNEWWISTYDVIRFLTNTKNPSSFLSNLKKDNKALLRISHKFKLLSKDNKYRFTVCATIEDTFRVLMDIPSPKVQNLSRWLGEIKNSAYNEIPQFPREHENNLKK